MASHLGFNYQNNRLGYAGNDGSGMFGGAGGSSGRHASSQQFANNQRADAYGIDDGRRGHFIPSNARAINAPVAMANRGSDTFAGGQRRREIEPTAPGGSIHAPGAGRAARQDNNGGRANVPLALPSGSDTAIPRRAPAAAAQNNAAARAHRVPR